MAPLTSVCVYCGSNAGDSPAYRRAAAELGALLAARGIEMIFGGGRRGLMGALADAALAHGGRVVGIIPRFLRDLELEHRGVSELRIVETMHERKALMASRAEAFIALPGGIGTLEEMFEAWTWTQLGSQSKPVGLLDVEGFYQPLIVFLDRLVTERFLGAAHRGILQVSQDPGDLLERLGAWEPSAERKGASPGGT